MDDLKKLSETWVKSRAYDPAIQRQLWDRAASDYRELKIPDPKENAFLRHMRTALPLDASLRTLDVGCGSGIYSMALAPYVQEAVGIDISPNMIRYAKERSRALGLSNTAFHCLDWSEADVEQLGFSDGFDIVFAHMTPAVDDYQTFDKLNRCSRKLCMVEKPARRRDRIQDGAFAQIGLRPCNAQDQGGILQAFSYLWYHGYCPQLSYQEDEWESEKTVEDMTAWCTDRARLQRKLTAAEEAAIARFVEGQAKDGMVLEVTKTTRVTILWRVELAHNGKNPNTERWNF